MDDRLLEDEGRVGRYSWRSAGEDGAKSGFDPMAVDGRAIWEAECAVEVEEGIGKICFCFKWYMFIQYTPQNLL